MAFYGYARLVDQVGDAYDGDRMEALAWIEDETTRALADPGSSQILPLVARAAWSVTALGLDPAPLYRLIAANRQDQTVTAYESASRTSLGYCRLSANPAGRGNPVLGCLSVSPDTRPDPLLRLHLQRATAGRALARRRRRRHRRKGVPAPGHLEAPTCVASVWTCGRPPGACTSAGPRITRADDLRMLGASADITRRLLGEGAPLDLSQLRGSRSRWAVARASGPVGWPPSTP